MATPSEQMIWGTIDTPNAEEVAEKHPMIWSPTEARWIDVKEEQEEAAAQTTTTQPAAENPAPMAGFVMPDWGYYVIGAVAIAAVAGVGYYAYKKWK